MRVAFRASMTMSLFPKSHPDSPRLLALGVIASILALTGCGPRLNVKPELVVDLSGEWQLNASLSDDPQVLLEQHRPARRPERERRPPGDAVETNAGNAAPPPGGPQSSGERAPVRRRPDEPSRIEDYVVQPARLSIQQGGQELRLVADGSPTRFVYGVRFGTSSMRGVSRRRSGWEANAFVTYEEVTDGPDVTSTYALQGNQLIVSTRVSGGGVPNLAFRAVYDRAAAQL